MAGAAAPFGFQGVAARPRPRRQLPAGAPLGHRGGHPVAHDGQCRDYGGKEHEKEWAEQRFGDGAGSGARIGEVNELPGGERDDQAAALASGRRRAGADGRAGPAAAGSAGMSVVSAARSARVRAASARPTRMPSSSLVSRPCTNACFSASITCSRSAWPARIWSRLAAAGSCGPAITGTSPSHDAGKRSAAARPDPSCSHATIDRTAVA
jgi:hypothetical protein